MSIFTTKLQVNKLLSLTLVTLLASFLTACDSEQKAESKQAETLNFQVSQEAEKTASLDALQSCFAEKYYVNEDLEASTRVIAQKIRGLCSDQFTHVRASKFNYEAIDEVTAPNQKMIDGEIALTMLYVERSRADMRRYMESYRMPAEGSLPHGHPPVDSFEQPYKKKVSFI